MSVLLGVSGMLGWGIYDFLGGVLAKRFGSFRPLFWSQLAGAVAIGAAAAMLGDSWHSRLSTLLLVPLAAGLYCGGYLFFFAGFAKGNVSIVAATMNLWAVVTMAVAFVVVGQRLSSTQTIGAFAIIGGATLASIDWTQTRASGLGASAGVPDTLAGAVLFGLYWNVSEAISEELGWLYTTALIKTTIVVILLGITALTNRPTRLPASSTRTLLLVTGMGLIEVSAVAAVNYGLQVGTAILITPIASALSVVTIALAVLLLHEKVSTLQTIGITLAVLGIITTAL